MKRLFLVLTLLLAFAFVLVGCGDSKTPAQTTTDTPPSTTPPPEPVYYDITFMVDGTATVVKTAAGEIPVFSGSTDLPMTASTIYTFTGWNKALAPAIENTMYVACYDRTTRTYPVHFSISGTVVKTVEVKYGATAEYPDGTSYNGLNIAFWTNTANIRGETTCEAVCSSYDTETLLWAYGQEPIKYKNHYEGDGNVNSSSSAMLYLILAEHDDKAAGYIRDRALLHLRSLITGGNEPGYNAGPFWSYAAVSMAIATARYTPTIWNELTTDEKDRLSFLMECYAILACFVSDDDNNYKTGPALTGNFAKTWNPNHRMAMILPIVASTAFFSAEGADGAARVNAILTGFDHDAYIARCNEYGFTRIIYNWTTEGMTLSDGTVAPGAKELMMNGGDAYICHEDSGTTSNNIQLGTYVNGGVGVRTTYTYGKATLYELSKIIGSLYSNNYSGGAVISDSSSVANGTDPATGKPYAYIVDGTRSPFEGELGMMKEFISSDGGGIRSSTSYCTHDFVLVVESLAALEAMGIYQADVDSELFRLMWVGNGDLVYKNEHGYNSYSIGKDRGQSNDASYPYYLPWKAWWQAHYGDALELTRPIYYNLAGGTVSDAVDSYTHSDTDTVITLPTPTHVAGSFLGWFLDAACKTSATDKLTIADGKLTIKAGYSDAVTLYASFEIDASVAKAKVIIDLPSRFGLDGVYDGVYYDLGADFAFALPEIAIPAGYELLSWHLQPDFSDAPITGDVFVIPAVIAALHQDITLYPRIIGTFYEQKENGMLEIPFSEKAASDGQGMTLRQELAADGSVLLSKYAGEDGYFRVQNMDIKTGFLTIEATIYMDETLQMVASGFRLRPKNGNNTPDTVSIGANGIIKIGGVEVGAVSKTPTKFAFVFYEQEDGVGYDIDFYANGVYVATASHDITDAKTNEIVDIANIGTLHWYFSKGNVGSMHIADLRVVDGYSVTTD